jgi:hypothetical protein
MKRPIAVVCSAAIGVGGCANSSNDISPAYVSPLQYQAYDCGQIAVEVQRVQARVVELGGRLDQAASNDKAIVGAGLILFWPALFALGGTKQQEAEYARLRGEYDAIEQAAVSKRCQTAVADPTTAQRTATSTSMAVSVEDAQKQLELLRELKSKGLLTETEFEAKRVALAESAISGQPIKSHASAASGAPTASLAGLRVPLRDRAPYSKVVTGETVLTIDSVAERGTVLNGGSTTLDSTGRLLTGTFTAPYITGLGGGRLTMGSTAIASFVPSSTALPPVDLRIRVLRMDSIRVSGRDVTVAKCAVSGYSGRSQQPPVNSRPGSEISGEISVEPRTGLVLSATIESSDTYYSLYREITPTAMH